LDLKLQEALSQISEIRHQLARSEVFRGYRAAPAALSGVVAVGAALVQAVWIAEPTRALPAYLALWVGTAAIGIAAALAVMVDRQRRGASTWGRELAAQALEQFVPSLIAGGLLTAVVVVTAADAAWMLPGLWQVVFALGLFATGRLLPRPMKLVAAWYLTTGIACLARYQGAEALSPWAMGLPFGVGQALAAAVLYWTLERPEEARR
jgi:hypothetical protein